MSYCGDSSLSGEIQERVNGTFVQTLDLATAGQKVEALLGCDFILRLDSLFEPARVLQQQIQNSESIEPAALLALAGLGEAPAPEAPPVAPLPSAPESPSTMGAPSGEAERKALEGVYGHAVEPGEPAQLYEKPASFDEPEPQGDLYEPEAANTPAQEPPAPPETVSSAPAAEDVIVNDLGDRRSTGIGDIPDVKRDPTSGPPPTPEARRIEVLLSEGEEALFRGETQKAIDTWSRIFLIDVDNAEASSRIEKAQLVKAENERKIEEYFSDASILLKAGEPEAALLGFEKILELEPDHPGATRQIERLRSPKGADASEDSDPSLSLSSSHSSNGGSDPMLAPPLPDLIEHDEFDDFEESFPAPKPPRTLSPNWRFIAIGSGVLVLVVVGAVLLNSNWGRLFPNSEDEVVAAPRNLPDRIARITALHERGETEQAVSALKQINSDSPDYERAQLLLAELEGPPESAEAPAEDARQAQSALIEKAREAYSAGEYLAAARFFNRASAVAPLEGPEADLFDDSKRQLEPILQMVNMYRQRQYRMALPALWRYRYENPTNSDVRRLLINSHYNMAILSLRKGLPKEAVALAEESVKLDQDDAYAQRLLLFAQSYENSSPDLLYQIFIDNLEIRP